MREGFVTVGRMGPNLSLTNGLLMGVAISFPLRFLKSFPALTSNPRAMDALPVACALECRPDLFATSDSRQLPAAGNAGLRTEYLGRQLRGVLLISKGFAGIPFL